MERPGTSFRTTETVAGCRPRCSASFFKLVVLGARCFPVPSLTDFQNITVFFSHVCANQCSRTHIACEVWARIDTTALDRRALRTMKCAIGVLWRDLEAILRLPGDLGP